MHDTLKVEKRGLSIDEVYDCVYTLSLSIMLKEVKGQGQCLQILTDSLRTSKNKCLDFLLIDPVSDRKNKLQNRAFNNMMPSDNQDSYQTKIDLRLFIRVFEDSI